jgi:hypothetical protein
MKVARRYLMSCGLRTVEPVDHEDAITAPLAAGHVRKVIAFPSDEFVALTGCDEWEMPIAG